MQTRGPTDQATDSRGILVDQLYSGGSEATTSAQVTICQAHDRVEAYARDNSLIIAEDENLKALLLAAEEAFQSRRNALIASEQRRQLATDGFKQQNRPTQQLRSVFERLRSGDLGPDDLRGVNTEFEKLVTTFDQLGVVIPNIEQLREEITGLANEDLAQINRENFATGLAQTMQEANTEIRNLLASMRDLEASPDQLQEFNQQFEAIFTNLQNIGVVIPNIEQLRTTVAGLADQSIDRQLAPLADIVEARQAQYEDDLRSQRQAEEAKRQENEKTYDFDAYLIGLRTKNRQAASQDLVRIEERALDATSQSQRENLIRETQQFIDTYAQRGDAFRDLVADAQDLGVELQQAFDLTEQTRRLEDFRDSLADVISDLAGIAIDHIFDSFGDSVQRATLAIGTFVDEVRGEIQLLQDDITRLLRFDEDAAIRRERLGEDRDRRIAQLQRQRQVIASRAPVGDQQGLERNRQAQQDLTARIASLRGDFNVRLDRFDEDRDLRRDRLIEDALKRLADAQSRGLRRPEEDESLVRKLLVSLGNTITNSLSNAVGDAISNFALDALSKPIQNLIDSIKNLFGGDDDW